MGGIWGIAALVFAVNLPFGWWRAGTRRLSLAWLLAIHVPVVLAIGLRILAGTPFRLATLPVFVAAFAAGQFLGGVSRRRVEGTGAS